ncbi:MAG: hypothetical protein Q8Q00_04835 [Dehalococcoidia bacterium]|nr:hypothetical protein [Dehalococcoidia bacterium]
MTVMLTGLPRVSWRRFFRHLTTQGQRELERALADCGLLLGEYMELVERAYLEAYVLQEASPGGERVDLDVTAQAVAARLIGGYVTRKRLFLLLVASRQDQAWAKLSGALPRETYAADCSWHTPPLRVGLSPSYKRRLRQRIHAQMKVMKRARG